MDGIERATGVPQMSLFTLKWMLLWPILALACAEPCRSTSRADQPSHASQPVFSVEGSNEWEDVRDQDYADENPDSDAVQEGDYLTPTFGKPYQILSPHTTLSSMCKRVDENGFCTLRLLPWALTPEELRGNVDCDTAPPPKLRLRPGQGDTFDVLLWRSPKTAPVCWIVENQRIAIDDIPLDVLALRIPCTSSKTWYFARSTDVFRVAEHEMLGRIRGAEAGSAYVLRRDGQPVVVTLDKHDQVNLEGCGPINCYEMFVNDQMQASYCSDVAFACASGPSQDWAIYLTMRHDGSMGVDAIPKTRPPCLFP